MKPLHYHIILLLIVVDMVFSHLTKSVKSIRASNPSRPDADRCILLFGVMTYAIMPVYTCLVKKEFKEMVNDKKILIICIPFKIKTTSLLQHKLTATRNKLHTSIKRWSEENQIKR